MVLDDQHVDRDGRGVDPEECPQTELEQQASLEVAQLAIARHVKRRKHHLVFELSSPLSSIRQEQS